MLWFPKNWLQRLGPNVEFFWCWVRDQKLRGALWHCATKPMSLCSHGCHRSSNDRWSIGTNLQKYYFLFLYRYSTCRYSHTLAAVGVLSHALYHSVTTHLVFGSALHAKRGTELVFLDFLPMRVSEEGFAFISFGKIQFWPRCIWD